MDERIKSILEKFPFLTYGCLNDQHYLGIVQNCDTQMISIYVLDIIPDEKTRRLFLHYGTEWWWESNRQVPINLFLKERFLPFRPYLKHFNRKEFSVLAGPTVSLQDTILRRVRKRQITLMKRMPPEGAV